MAPTLCGSFILIDFLVNFFEARELGTLMIHFPKEMVSRSEKFETVPVFHLIRKDGGVVFMVENFGNFRNDV